MWVVSPSLVHDELLAQGDVLEGELPVAAAKNGEESQQVEQEGDHHARILARPALTDQPPPGGVLAKDMRQGC